MQSYSSSSSSMTAQHMRHSCLQQLRIAWPLQLGTAAWPTAFTSSPASRVEAVVITQRRAIIAVSGVRKLHMLCQVCWLLPHMVEMPASVPYTCMHPATFLVCRVYCTLPCLPLSLQLRQLWRPC